MNMKRTAMAAALTLATGIASAASVSTGGVFQMNVNDGLDQAYSAGSGSAVNTDNTISGFVDETAGTWGVSSATPFFGAIWTASNGQLLTTPGNYAMSTATGVVSAATPDTTGAQDSSMHFTIGAGQIAGTIDFAWGVTTGIRVINVWDINANGSLSTAAVPGMENGPFPNYNAAFELTAAGLVEPPAVIPVPAAVWLFGSGLVGLVGVARRKKKEA